MKGKKVLVVDDEEDILELVDFNLSQNGFHVIRATNGEEAIRVAETTSPNLIILDLMLPGIDGLEVCRLLKRNDKTEHIPIIMLTVKGDEADIVTGLELGADDYITKPFSPKILVARVRTILRRLSPKNPNKDTSPLDFGDLVIHPGRHEVLVNGMSVKLTHTEFSILHTLAKRPGWVFTRDKIIDAVRGENYPVTDRSVDVHIVNLRKKLGNAARHIETIHGAGYRFRG